MAFTVSFGTSSSEKRALTKSVSTVVSATGTLRNESSVINPSILVQASASTLSGCNYMEISEFGRKYFITDVVAVSDKLSMVSGHCDVLSTYASGIKSNSCILKRSNNVNDPWINDGSYVMKSQMDTQYIPFNTFFTKADSIILVTV